MQLYCVTATFDERRYSGHAAEMDTVVTWFFEEEDFHIDSEVGCEGAHPLCGALSRRGLDPTELAYDPRRPDGRQMSHLID